MLKTSHTHPLRFDAVPAGAGLIGMVFCPGKTQNGAIFGDWQRDLTLDLDAIQAWGATVVVSLLETFELAALGVADLGEQVEQRGLTWMHLPIVDMDVPDEAFEKTWRIAGLILRERLRRGERILLHCVGGLGRTGTIAARILCEFGAAPTDAIAQVRAARRGTIQTSTQEENIRHHSRPIPAREDARQSRFFGCLIGGMLGDAVGYPLEFDASDDWQSQACQCHLETRELPAAMLCSDDSQLTLATALGLAECHAPSEMPARIRAAYIDWYAGQRGHEVSSDWMRSHPAMSAARAPGTTCMQSLAIQWRGEPWRDNDRKGAGALMRIAPIAFLPGSLNSRLILANYAGTLTHGHPTSAIACMTWVVMLDVLQSGQSLSQAQEAAMVYLKDIEPFHEMRAAMQTASELAQQPQRRALGHIGEGWIAEEALAIALYANLLAKARDEVLEIAVCHDGDSDTTGSLAMQLYGCQHGLTALPWKWIKTLDLLPALLELPSFEAWQGIDASDDQSEDDLHLETGSTYTGAAQ